MLISSELFILALVTLSYPLVLLRVFSLLQRPKKEIKQNILNKMEALARADTAATLRKTERIFTEHLAATSNKHLEILSNLEAALKSDYERNRRELKTASSKYLSETKIALAGLVKNAERLVNEELTKELQATKTELENYKKIKTKKIDEEIATLVEKTIYLTLGKALSLKDQIDLIYESLAEAKEEGFFEKNVE